MFPQPTLPLTLPSSCHLSLTLDQKTSRKWLKKRNHAEPRTLIRSLYWQKTGTQSPRQAAFNLFSFDLHRLLIFPGKKKSLPCPSQLFSLILVLQSRLYWIPRGHCGCCSLTHVLSFPAVQTLTLSGQQAVHISGVRHSWRKRVRDGSGVRHSWRKQVRAWASCLSPLLLSTVTERPPSPQATSKRWWNLSAWPAREHVRQSFLQTDLEELSIRNKLLLC